jgi:antitoxin ParD1/3/4
MVRGATLNVSLTPKLDRYVRSKVASGRYESASEVIRESLRLSQAVEEGEQLFWASVRGKVAEARRQVAMGATVDGDTAMDQIIEEAGGGRRLSRRRKKAAG